MRIRVPEDVSGKQDKYIQQVVNANIKKDKKNKEKSKSTLKSVLKLGKAKAKLPSYSATKFVKGIAQGHHALVKESLPREEFEGNRSLFFKEEYERERKRSII